MIEKSSKNILISIPVNFEFLPVVALLDKGVLAVVPKKLVVVAAVALEPGSTPHYTQPSPGIYVEVAVRVAPLLVIAAGGTGGHMFPAQALAEAMLARGWRVRLSTDAV